MKKILAFLVLLIMCTLGINAQDTIFVKSRVVHGDKTCSKIYGKVYQEITNPSTIRKKDKNYFHCECDKDYRVRATKYEYKFIPRDMGVLFRRNSSFVCSLRPYVASQTMGAARVSPTPLDNKHSHGRKCIYIGTFEGWGSKTVIYLDPEVSENKNKYNLMNEIKTKFNGFLFQPLKTWCWYVGDCSRCNGTGKIECEEIDWEEYNDKLIMITRKVKNPCPSCNGLGKDSITRIIDLYAKPCLEFLIQQETRSKVDDSGNAVQRSPIDWNRLRKTWTCIYELP